jgi:hypothetical protein
MAARSTFLESYSCETIEANPTECLRVELTRRHSVEHESLQKPIPTPLARGLGWYGIED